MKNSDTLYINMLGGCSFTYGDITLDDSSVRSRKIWTLLEYLVVFRNRDISQEELIDLIYPDENSKNPINALKTLLHRARATLDTLKHTDSKNIILQRRGGYTWNTDLNIEVDVDRFEEMCSSASNLSLPEGERIALYMSAMNLYKGDFLPKSSMDTWVIPISTYYRSMFMSAVASLIEILRGRGDYHSIISVCQKGISIDPYNEDLYYSLMLSLSKTNQTQAALAQYDGMTKLFYSEFGVTPSDEIKALYKELIKSSQNVELDLGVIKSHMRDNEDSGAFFCEYEFFKDIYRLEVRSADRTGRPVHVCLITVVGQDNTQLSLKSLNTAMDNLKSSIKQSLRRGDVFSRYSISQFIIMLPLTTYSNAEMAVGRIVKRFYRDNPRSKATLNYSLQAIDTSLV